MKKQRSIIWFILCIFLQNVIYGFGNPLAKIGNSDMGTFWCPAARFLVASAVMLIFFGRRILVQLRAAGWKKWLPPSICLMCNFILFNLAIMFSSVTTTAFLNSMAVFFAPVMSSVFLGGGTGLRPFPSSWPLLWACFFCAATETHSPSASARFLRFSLQLPLQARLSLPRALPERWILWQPPAHRFL